MIPEAVSTTSPVKLSGLTLRLYEPGDELEILPLWSNAFSRQRSVDHWRWRFEQNPLGRAIVVVCSDDASGRIVGHLGTVAQRLRTGDATALSYQLVDAVIHPDFKLKGVFQGLVQFIERAARDQSARLITGYPNEKSLPILTRQLGYHQFVSYHSYELKLRSITDVGKRESKMMTAARRALNTMRRRRLTARELRLARGAGHVSFRIGNCLPARLPSCDGLGSIFVDKDDAYLRWRYEENPSHTFEYSWLSDGDEILLLAVVNGERDVATICDLIATTSRAVEYVPLLMARVASVYFQKGHRRLRLWANGEIISSSLAKTFPVRRSTPLVGIQKVLAEPADRPIVDVSRSRNWWVTFGDTDAY